MTQAFTSSRASTTLLLDWLMGSSASVTLFSNENKVLSWLVGIFATRFVWCLPFKFTTSFSPYPPPQRQVSSGGRGEGKSWEGEGRVEEGREKARKQYIMVTSEWTDSIPSISFSTWIPKRGPNILKSFTFLAVTVTRNVALVFISSVGNNILPFTWCFHKADLALLFLNLIWG